MGKTYKHEAVFKRVFNVHLVRAVFSLSISYSVISRFSNYFLASRPEKLGFLGVMVVGAIVVFLLLPRRLFDFRLYRGNFKHVFLGGVMASAVFFLLIPPLAFPENHTLTISPTIDPQTGHFTIKSIERIEYPSGELHPIHPSQVELNGDGWTVNDSQGSITWEGDSPAELAYERLMQAGIRIHFIGLSDQGKLRIFWDGAEKVIYLSSENKNGDSIVDLDPGFDWGRVDGFLKIFVGIAFVAEYMALTITAISLFLLPKVFTFRHIKLLLQSIRHIKVLLLSISLLVFLLPIISAMNPIVIFNDVNLESAIRDIIDLPNRPIHRNDILSIVKLDFTASDIADLSGIEHLTNLEDLNLRDNNIVSIKSLNELRKLRSLNLRGNQIIDISPIRENHKLESLNIRDNPIADISPIEGLITLRDLNISGIQLSDGLGFLSNMSKLEKLNIRNCGIEDLSPLAEIMAKGSIQNDPNSGRTTEIDIRDNPIPLSPINGYALLRPFWGNISLRAPFQLPIYSDKQAPRFSQKGGFYSEAFQLEITVPDPHAIIYFTVDGSSPSLDSERYSHSIPIQFPDLAQSKVENTQKISPILDDTINQMARATVIRASAFYPDGAFSPITTHTFFIKNHSKNQYSLPVVSIATDPIFLFDDVVGIYTTGELGAEPEKSLANYDQRGVEWERPINVEVFNSDGQIILSQLAGLRIHGATTRGYPQKPLRLIADDLYGFSNFTSTQLFPEMPYAAKGTQIKDFQTLLLRNSGNAWNFFFFRDAMLQNLVDNDILDVQASRPIILLLNGDYWGIYDLREQINANYLASHYGIDPNEIVILERDAQINHGQHGDQVSYQNMLNYIRDHHPIEKDNHYEYIASLMDINNYIDYQIAEIYSSNQNWPHDNIKYWRYKADSYSPDASPGLNGKWRWLLFDVDSGFGVIGGEQMIKENTMQAAEGEFLFRSLLYNPKFRTRFINRFADQLNTNFESSRVIGVVEDMHSSLKPEMQNHVSRWNILDTSVQEWERSLQILYRFAEERPNHIRQHLIERFSLDGLYSVNIKQDTEKGYTRVNSIDIISTTPGVVEGAEWTGIYFKGVPIKVTAIPQPGFRFTGWKGSDKMDASFEILAESDIVFEAVFEPVSNQLPGN